MDLCRILKKFKGLQYITSRDLELPSFDSIVLILTCLCERVDIDTPKEVPTPRVHSDLAWSQYHRDQVDFIEKIISNIPQDSTMYSRIQREGIAGESVINDPTKFHSLCWCFVDAYREIIKQRRQKKDEKQISSTSKHVFPAVRERLMKEKMEKEKAETLKSEEKRRIEEMNNRIRIENEKKAEIARKKRAKYEMEHSKSSEVEEEETCSGSPLHEEQTQSHITEHRPCEMSLDPDESSRILASYYSPSISVISQSNGIGSSEISPKEPRKTSYSPYSHPISSDIHPHSSSVELPFDDRRYVMLSERCAALEARIQRLQEKNIYLNSLLEDLSSPVHDLSLVLKHGCGKEATEVCSVVLRKGIGRFIEEMKMIDAKKRDRTTMAYLSDEFSPLQSDARRPTPGSSGLSSHEDVGKERLCYSHESSSQDSLNEGINH
ncbi:hypothetical protein ADUPG1_013616 [Aduncisulcus paluster]|uniref:Uncharacterized protein n=1 Tax=Aduncisulcus paluster TaxID=2918883 RepID=A0ABQ5K5M0_9EUKA|nr:hypothetical protein ADUPG1_013616 [Aduncisulcus paluster]